MGAKHTKLYSTMFVVGGCELPLEKNPYATIDVISTADTSLKVT